MDNSYISELWRVLKFMEIGNVRVGVLILNYKTFSNTVTCMESILKNSSAKTDVEILIVDNCSPNESYEYLSNLIKTGKYKNVSIVKTEHNGGYSYGNNFGLTEIKKRGIDYCIVTNNDVVFHNNSISEMIAPLRADAKRVLVVPKVLNSNGNVTSLPTIKKRKILKWVVGGADGKNAYRKDQASNVYSFSGCCFACNVKLMAQIGMFDENVFLYCEEAILSKKIADAGYSIYYAPEAVITHFHGVTTGKCSAFVDSEYSKSLLYYLSEYENVRIRLWGIKRLLILKIRLKALLSKYSDKDKLASYIKQINLKYRQIKNGGNH